MVKIFQIHTEFKNTGTEIKAIFCFVGGAYGDPTPANLKGCGCVFILLTSYRWDDLIQQFHTGSLPNLLDNSPQLLIGLFKIT